MFADRVADGHIENQFGIALDSDIHVSIAHSDVIFGANALLFLAYVLPHFVNFDIGNRNVANQRTHERSALFARNQKFHDRVLIDSGDALRAANAGTFKSRRVFENEYGAFHRNSHRLERLREFFGIGLAAIGAMEALRAVAVLAEATAGGLAFGADHGLFGFGDHVTIIQQALAVVNAARGYFWKRPPSQAGPLGCDAG